MNQEKLLIIEDDPGLQSQMRWCFDDIEVFVAGDAEQALGVLRKESPTVVTLDLGLPPDPGGTSVGFELLDDISTLLPTAKVIVITGREEKQHALTALAKGAYDFYQKPIDADTLNFVVERAFRLSRLEAENRRLLSHTAYTPLDGLIANSRNMIELCRSAEKVAPTDATVLLLGETGTGKEVIAHAIHDLSDNREGPFVAINCAAIPENLLESELFGHEKGSFTGAVGQKIGKIESAQGGTLFLDEIGDMPLSLQAKILRFLQERCFERVGGNQLLHVDVRVLAATHKPLSEMIEQGDFREDLYFRISEIGLSIPPLRERDGDALLLSQVFIEKFAAGKNLHLSVEARSAIESWNWPGNIRELENRIKRACIMCENRTIRPQDLELESSVKPTSEMPLNLKQVREEAEIAAIERALSHCENNLTQAARLLGISRPTLYNLLQRYNLGVNH